MPQQHALRGREPETIIRQPFTDITRQRFVLHPSSVKLGGIEDQIYFHGVGDVITMWNPAVLLGLGDEFAVFKIYCEQEMAETLGKGKGK